MHLKTISLAIITVHYFVLFCVFEDKILICLFSFACLFNCSIGEKMSDDESIHSIDMQSESENEMELHDIPSSSKSNLKPNSNNKYESEDMEFEMFVGEKINSLVLSTKRDMHIFRKHSVHSLGTRYRCRAEKCRAFVVLSPDEKTCIKLKNSPKHKHTTKVQNVETYYWDRMAMNEMRAQCSNLANIAGGKRLAEVRSIFANVKQQ